MKYLVKLFLDKIIVRFINYCIDRMHPIQIKSCSTFNVNLQRPVEVYANNPLEINFRNPIEVYTNNPLSVVTKNNCVSIAYEIAKNEAANIIMKHVDSCMLFSSKELLWEYCFNNIKSGLIMEFGVFEGYSINYFSKIILDKNDTRIIHGFDSFNGLPENWNGTADWNRITFSKEAFKLNSKLPNVNDNVMLHIGMIQETLQPFLDENKEDISLIHVDTDIYSSAFYILSTLKERVKSGTIIIFDELLSYPGYKLGEYKALLEVFDENQFKYIGFSSHEQVAIQIL